MQANLEVILERITTGQDLSRDQSRWLFNEIMTGELPESVIGALLGALLTKGESVDELIGAAEAMRENAVGIRCDADCIDICGTGGDGISTFNVSTTAAIIAAAAGATVAKHGNGSTKRVSGSTEVLTSLGIDVEADPPTVERCLSEVRIGYLNARKLHPAMRHAAPVRQALPVRTIFNLLGPLSSPAGVRRQVLGVSRPELLDLIANALSGLGTEHAWVVHAADGLCDLTITGPTTVLEVRDGTHRRFEVVPEEFGLERVSLDALRVDSPGASAEKVLSILRGEPGPPRDHALLNAGAALVVAGLADELDDGLWQAARAVNEGAAMDTLTKWCSLASGPTVDESSGRSST